MKCYGFEINMICRGKCALPEWLGSTIRGALGTELIKLCCVNKKPDCGKCPPMFGCSAKTMLLSAPPDSGESAVNPYVIRNYSFDGRELCFELFLFGDGVSCARDIFRILSGGLRLGSGMELFSLKSIKCFFTGGYIFDGCIWVAPDLHELPLRSFSAGRITVDFLTPWVTKDREKHTSFDRFARACTRRATSVLRCCGYDIPADIKSIFEAAKAVETVSEALEASAVSRYSSRTDKKMNLEGYKGSITFEGDISPFSEYISICGFLGIGKLCVMGLGQFEISEA